MDAIARLRDAGAEVVELDLGEDFSAIVDRFTWSLFLGEAHQGITTFLRQNDVPVSFEEIHAELRSPLNAIWTERVLPGGASAIAPDAYEASLSVDRPEIQRRLGAVFTRSGFDALLAPTTPCPAPAIEQQSAFTIAGEAVNELVLARNTVPASGADLPGISIPIGRSSQGLPIGLELDGAHGDDRRLLDVARRVHALFARLPAPA
jgi:mandelamide amidase